MTCPDSGTADDVFADLRVDRDGDVVLMTGRLDQSALHGVLERVRARNWRLLDVRRTRPFPGGRITEEVRGG